jgi:hypothetical protein
LIGVEVSSSREVEEKCNVDVSPSEEAKIAILFDRQDENYLDWIKGHQVGYVVNAYRNLDPSYLMLHRASCGTISGKPTRGNTWTNGDFVKVCSETVSDLELWARRDTTGSLTPCQLCRPERLQFS